MRKKKCCEKENIIIITELDYDDGYKCMNMHECPSYM